MKPITVQLPPDYAEIVERVRKELNGFNPTGRSISACHILRYSLRVAGGERRGRATAEKVLHNEDARGKWRKGKIEPPQLES
jgi:hypothetical protein